MRFYPLILFLLISIFATACEGTSSPSEKARLSPSSQSSLEQKDTFELPSEISVSAIGDVLIHDRVYNDAKTSNGYDFMPMLKQVKPYLEDTTITMANQETMVGGEELGLSGYPSFNTPKEMGDNLKQLGVDVVTLANNHSLDKGARGIRSAIEHWETIGMMYTGVYKSKEDSENIRVYETKQGIDIAFLSYTYGTNGISVPESESYLVNLIDKREMKQDIAQAKEISDAVILSLHFGKQYEPMPNERQKKLVQFTADLGVDVVIGHHPHVLQPIEWVEGKQGNKMLAVYSLGNFFSGQDAFKKRIGGIIKFNIVKDQNNVQVKDPRFLLTYVTSSGAHNYEVIPMHKLTPTQLKNYKQVMEEQKQHLSQWLPELAFIE
ncbi:CapA family protein [Halobacillus shinanisalinarum]|uniref:CapA family protein n=1 Tax=Halobacillus shinanisalinarum TaxID=2932258 RepID=A0ABY4H4J0_9BACI|nr:CapA family protein [Halobacillus shinanisalinarum]UOQ95380.1 CapA family protein [Halobacillus shinanisalinarum]